MPTGEGPLKGLRIVDLSTSLPTAFATTVFADYGAEVVQIEPPGGSPLREQAGWPFWFRGKKSIVLDFHEPDDLAVARSLLLDADAAIEAFRPGVTDRLGIGYSTLAKENPGLVYTSITGFGRHGPYAELKGYDAIVQAKMGTFHASPTGRPGPAMASHPSPTFGAGLLAMYGTLVALFERERSGLGQQVDTTLVQGVSGQDPWGWILRLLAKRYPDAFVEANRGLDANGVPTTWLIFSVMAGLSKEGRWLQFAHATPKQFESFLKALDLDWIRSDAEMKDAPDTPDGVKRNRFWEMALDAVRSKTVEEWYEIFDEDTDLFAELFRSGTEAFDHPQMLHDHHTLDLDLPGLGKVREPNVLVKMSVTPGSGLGAVPTAGQHDAELRSRPRRTKRAPVVSAANEPPLKGITILELGTFFAAPFGTAMLADMGARVIKVESIPGDQIRFVQPIPEAGGVRVTQGKEAIAVDFTTPEGKEIVYELARRADMVLQSYRGGVARRLGYDHETLLSINPNLVYHYGQGYGIDGPYAHRPAYNPVIAAACGFARRVVRGVPESTDLTMPEIKKWAVSSRALGAGGPDGFSAFGVGVAMALGLLARERGAGGQWTLTSMLSTMAHVTSDDMIEYEGRPAVATVDSADLGYNALYRLYETSEGWIVLCITNDREWAALSEILASHVDLAGDSRFATASDRAANDAVLAEVLSNVFRKQTGAEWEKLLTPADVACAEVENSGAHGIMDEGGLAEQLGMTAVVEHPLFGTHLRATALAALSRSGTDIRPGCLVGQYTDSILHELGYSDERIAELRAAEIVGG
jgi:crotonobetainyl-CoA:carnitine CoA-transferase CaiB-like acyl-CoA transferase